MKYNPHDYQKYAEDFIISHPACALMLDMGLGKTVITLTALWLLCLDFFELGHICVIGPKRVIEVGWPAELSKWEHLTGLSYSVVAGSEKQRIEALKKPAFLYLISRDNVSWLIESGYWNFDGCIIDELSSFKSTKAKRFRNMKKVRGTCKRIVGLTGTPGNLMDLWAEIYLIDGGKRLERFVTAYRDRYFVPDKRSREMIFSYKPKEGAEDAIYSKISDICIAMKGKDYLKLPDLVVSNVEVEMSKKEQEMYDTLKSELVLPLEGGDIDAQSAVGLSNKLLQMSSGAVYDENGKTRIIHNQKLDALEDLIEAANGMPVLIAYWFRHDKERILERFDARVIETGKDIAAWNRNEIPIGLIHPMSAGHGLNLQEGGKACHIIWFSLTWSLEYYEQCNCRLYRQGQKNTVTVQHIVTKGTIDEDVLRALESKDCTQEAILNAVKARIR